MSTLTEIVLLSEHIPVTCQILQLNMSRIFLNFFLRQKQFHLTYSAVNSEGLVPNEVCFGLITKDLPVLSNTPSIIIILLLFFMSSVNPVLWNFLLHDHRPARRISIRKFSVQFAAAFITGWILSIWIDKEHTFSCLLYTILSTQVHREQETTINCYVCRVTHRKRARHSGLRRNCLSRSYLQACSQIHNLNILHIYYLNQHLKVRIFPSCYTYRIFSN